MKSPNFDMITIVNCCSCMNSVVILDPSLTMNTMVDGIKYGCVPMFVSSMCNSCVIKSEKTDGVTIPSNVPIAASMILTSTTYNRFVNTFNVRPRITGGGIHVIKHPNDIAYSVPIDCPIYSVIQNGHSHMSLVRYEEGDFF